MPLWQSSSGPSSDICRFHIRKILKHLRQWDPKPEQPDHPARDPPWPTDVTIPLTYHPVPDSA